MRVCITHDPRVGKYAVEVVGDSGVLRRYLADFVRVGRRFLPPTQDTCVEADTLEYDERVEGVLVEPAPKQPHKYLYRSLYRYLYRW